MPHRPSTNSAAGGFTLFELIVVAAIIAIVAALVIPSALGTSDMQALAAARIVAADLQYAQNTAITSQQPVTVTFNLAGEHYTLSNASGSLIHPMTKSAYVTNFASQDGFGKLNIVSASFGSGVSVTFDAMGSPDNGGTVRLQAGPHIYLVEVAVATGKVTVTSIGS